MQRKKEIKFLEKVVQMKIQREYGEIEERKFLEDI